ncbi:MAG: Gfo/Idh/MocA family protein [Egibacteraceae bacterium]
MSRSSGRVGLGIAGLGVAGSVMLPHVVRHPRVRLVVVADRRGPLAEQVAREHAAAACSTVEQLSAMPEVDAVYLATPTQLHAEHVLTAATAGKHVVVEKPMALDLAQADGMIAAAERAGVALMVGHSQSYEAPVRRMGALIRSGTLGNPLMLHNWYYTDWLYRPRTPDEFDTNRAGGVTYRQGAHQVDILRYLGGGLLASVRARTSHADPDRATEGGHVAYLEFEDGTPATAVYSGYDHFHSSELTFGLNEGGGRVDPERHATARARIRGLDADAEAALKSGDPSSLRQLQVLAPGGDQPFFGLTLVSCTQADLRGSPDGLLVYDDERRWEVSLAGEPSGRAALLDELAAAVLDGRPPLHDGRWGKANLEVCGAIVESSGRRQEVRLQHQVPVPLEAGEAG